MNHTSKIQNLLNRQGQSGISEQKYSSSQGMLDFTSFFNKELNNLPSDIKHGMNDYSKVSQKNRAVHNISNYSNRKSVRNDNNSKNTIKRNHEKINEENTKDKNNRNGLYSSTDKKRTDKSKSNIENNNQLQNRNVALENKHR